MDIFHELYGLPPDTRTDEQRAADRQFIAKLREYEAHFPGNGITTEGVLGLSMTEEDIIKNIDKCIKHNRKWEGFIVPELDYNDVDI